MCAESGKAGGYFGVYTVYHKTTGNFFLLNHPNLKWVTTNRVDMMNVSLPVTVIGGGSPFFFGRLVQGNITYLGKVHAGAGAFGNLSQK